MTATDDLRKLGEFPAVEEWDRYSSLGGYLPAEEAIIEKADAAIEELAETVLNPRPLGDHDEAMAVLRERAERAEAEAEAQRKRMRDTITDYDDKLNASRAEVARLEWMLERIRDSEYDHLSDVEARADLAARYEKEHDGTA